MKRTIIAAAAALGLTAVSASASVVGSTTVADESYNVDLFFTNTGADLLSLTIDGTTATSDQGTIFWDDYAYGGSAIVETENGENTEILNFTFALGDFAAGDKFEFSYLDPDFGGLNDTGVYVIDLVGVSVSAAFSDGSSFLGQFVDLVADDDQGLVLRGELTVVPLPAGLPLMLAGLGAFGIVSRRRRNNI